MRDASIISPNPEQQCHRHEQTNQALRTRLEDWQSKAERYKKELDSSETSSDTLRSEYRTTKAQMEAYQMELGTVRSTLSALEKDHQESLTVLLKKEADIDRLNGITVKIHSALDHALVENQSLNEHLVSVKNEQSTMESTVFDLQSTERTIKVCGTWHQDRTASFHVS